MSSFYNPPFTRQIFIACSRTGCRTCLICLCTVDRKAIASSDGASAFGECGLLCFQQESSGLQPSFRGIVGDVLAEVFELLRAADEMIERLLLPEPSRLFQCP